MTPAAPRVRRRRITEDPWRGEYERAAARRFYLDRLRIAPQREPDAALAGRSRGPLARPIASVLQAEGQGNDNPIPPRIPFHGQLDRGL